MNTSNPSHPTGTPLPDSPTLRTTLKPGDIGMIAYLHGMIYAREYSFDYTFEAYVARPLAEFALKNSPRERLWIVEQHDHIVGCIAIVEASADTAQLRWFLVDPTVRGFGLGHRLMNEAVTFCDQHGYTSITLWTVSALTAAAHLYQEFGFTKVEEKPSRCWGVNVVEEKYHRVIDNGGSI